jgi:hypothetical protein
MGDRFSFRDYLDTPKFVAAGTVFVVLIYCLNLGGAAVYEYFGLIPLSPPSLDCEPGEIDIDSIRHGKCHPLRGWHIEPRFDLSEVYIAVHDNADADQWQTDEATASFWRNLSRQQQKEILSGKATIHSFYTQEQINKVTIDQSLFDAPKETDR